jgi:2-polyprenyl-3-methyl-5-hydroxy-6-metoxy-1,4-benzoquinol methylase
MELRKTCSLCQSDLIFPIYSLKNFGICFNILKCKECGLTFRDILLNDEETAKLYSKNYFSEEQPDYFFNQSDIKLKILADKLDDIEKICPKKGNILDVGCAVGTFLIIAKKNGWNVTGVEVSEFASDYARKKFNLNVITGELSKLNMEQDSFDVITMWDVIEHLEKPQEILNIAFNLLKFNGIIVVQTTMEDSILTFIAKIIYYFSLKKIIWPLSRCHPVHHATFYTSLTLKKALIKSGFEIVQVKAFKMNTELVHTNIIMRIVLKFIMHIANLFNRPYEKIFIARKSKVL